MLILNKLLCRCEFCSSYRDEPIKKTVNKHAYRDIVYRYHQRCYEDVINNPEVYGNKIVDRALDLNQALSVIERENNAMKNARKKALKEARTRLKNKK